METILIRQELLELVKDGKKTTTCRNGIRKYPLGKTILKSNTSEDFAYINLEKLVYLKLKDITDDLAKDDGFDNKQKFFNVMKDIYPDINENSDITIVHFKLC